jgi:hypothetical protein
LNAPRSIIVAIIEKLPKLILAIAVLIGVVRAKPGDLPAIIKNLTESNVFCLTGWIVAVVELLVVCGAVAVYIRIKPKNNQRKKT